MKRRSKLLVSALIILAMVIGLIPGMSLTAYADDPYASLKNTTTVVHFDSKDWYLIDYDADTVTLFAKECIGASLYNDDVDGYYSTYDKSEVKNVVDNYYSSSMSSGVKSAVNGDAMFILNIEQARDTITNADVRKCSVVSGMDLGYWWLCSRGASEYLVATVNCDDGSVNAIGHTVGPYLGIRPALKLNLSSVIFSSESNTFYVKHSVTLSGGANAAAGGGATTQTDLIGAMTTVTYTANDSYKFPETSEYYTTTNGITVERTSDTVVTVSGTPTADANITVPDAKPVQNITAADVTVNYGDTDKSVSATTDGDGAISYAVKTGSEDYIEVNADTGALTIKKIPADGKAYVTVTAEETANYAKTTKEVTVTVNKADASVTADPEAKDLAWNGKAQKLVSEGTAEGGEMQYALGADDQTAPEGGWSTAVPEAADPGDYYIWYKAVGDENHNDSEAGYVKSTITAKQISYTVTFKVKNGSWDDKSTEKRKVTLSRYENEDKALVLKEEDIPKVGNEPAEHYKEGSWDVTPDTETEISEDAVYTYTYAAKEKISYTVTFKVVNGSWDDGKTKDVTVTLEGYQGEDLKLSKEQIPAVGSKPAEGYKEGSWNTVPDTKTAITKDTTYTYTYAKKPVYTVIEGANGKVQKGSGKGLTFKTDGDYSKFTGIKIDNRNVASSLYDSRSGSTIVELKPSCINQLSVGDHIIKFLYTDGSCEASFEVQAAATPTKTPTKTPANRSSSSGKTAAKTGDTNPLGLWMALIIAAAAACVAAVLIMRRSTVKNR